MTRVLSGTQELVGKAFGKNAKDAERRFRDLRPTYARGKKFRFQYMYTDPPFRVYEVYYLHTVAKTKRS